MQSEAEPKTQNPRTGLKTGRNHFGRGPNKTAHWFPATGSRREVSLPLAVNPEVRTAPPARTQPPEYGNVFEV
jgi:hypothetical protein